MVHPSSQQELAGLSVATATADAFRLPDKNKVLIACAREPDGGVHSHAFLMRLHLHTRIHHAFTIRIRIR